MLDEGREGGAMVDVGAGEEEGSEGQWWMLVLIKRRGVRGNGGCWC